MLRYLARECPALLLLPWEMMRKIGVVVRLNVFDAHYTFISHQWEQRASPFAPPAAKICEHIEAIETPWVWCDWWCVPQWSRGDGWVGGPDLLSLSIFKATMASFHQICYLASDAFCLCKRLQHHGLYFGEHDLGARLRRLVSNVDAALAVVHTKGSRLPTLLDEVELCSIDLEYAVRAWCALERCYLPDTKHTDVRLQKLLRTLDILLAEWRARARGSSSRLRDERAGGLPPCDCRVKND